MFIEHFFNFFNQGWVGSLIGIVGMILGVIGIFSYKISKSIAKPSYQISSIRLLGKDNNSLPNDVKILFQDKEVDRLTKTTIIFWNNGTETLEGKDIVDNYPLHVLFRDGDNILSYQVLKTTKKANNFQIIKDEKNHNKLLFKFSYLDPQDGAIIEILHDSKKRYPQISGVIKGIPKGIENLGRIPANRIAIDPGKSKRLDNLLDNPKFITAIRWFAVFLGMGLIIFGMIPEEIKNRITSYNNEINSIFDRPVFYILAGLLYIILPISTMWKTRKKYPKTLEMED